jgi:glc operon protein GlcG
MATWKQLKTASNDRAKRRLQHLRGKDMRNKPCLTSSEVQKMMAACKAEAAKHNWIVAIAIVDDAGFLLHLERTDGAAPTTPEVAAGKARTAALTRRPSKLMEERVKERAVFLKFPYGLPIQGGVPVMYEGECVGGIGVSGVQSHEDEQVAQAGVAALG